MLSAIRTFQTENFRLARHVFLVAAPLGVLVGCAIAGYDYVVNSFLWGYFSHAFPPLILTLVPIAGMLLTGLILVAFRVHSSSMADEVVLAYHRPETGIQYKAALPKLFASMATMGFGASAGMEGASKWLGGTIGAYLQSRCNRIPGLRALHGRVEITMLAGAAAGISAIFRAPLTGAIMGIESPYKRDLAHESLIHALVAAAASYATFISLRPSAPYFPIHFTYHLNLRDLLLCVPVGVLGGITSHVFLATLRSIKKTWGGWQAPRMLKYLAGGLLVSAVAMAAYFAIGEPVTLQAGLPIANGLLNGRYMLGACAIILVAKILATSLTFGTGGVGGLFVPSATIGAALGAVCDIVFQPSQAGLFTLVGIAAFTGASYNSLLFAAVFVAEATGSPALVVPSLLASCSAFLVSAGISNSEWQRSRRASDEAVLCSLPVGSWMSTKLVVVSPYQTLDTYLETTVVDHNFQELPVVDNSGILLGIMTLKSLRSVPRSEWSHRIVLTVMDTTRRTVSPDQNLLKVERELAHGGHRSIAVVDPETGKLVGILSASDILRARHQSSRN